MQQLRLRLFRGEGNDIVVVIANDGPYDVAVEGFVLLPGYYLEHIATPCATESFPQPQNEHVLAAIIEGTPISRDPPPYGAVYRLNPSD